jgi:hypothetical protein
MGWDIRVGSRQARMQGVRNMMMDESQGREGLVCVFI